MVIVADFLQLVLKRIFNIKEYHKNINMNPKPRTHQACFISFEESCVLGIQLSIQILLQLLRQIYYRDISACSSCLVSH